MARPRQVLARECLADSTLRDRQGHADSPLDQSPAAALGTRSPPGSAKVCFAKLKLFTQHPVDVDLILIVFLANVFQDFAAAHGEWTSAVRRPRNSGYDGPG